MNGWLSTINHMGSLTFNDVKYYIHVDLYRGSELRGSIGKFIETEANIVAHHGRQFMITHIMGIVNGQPDTEKYQMQIINNYNRPPYEYNLGDAGLIYEGFLGLKNDNYFDPSNLHILEQREK